MLPEGPQVFAPSTQHSRHQSEWARAEVFREELTQQGWDHCPQKGLNARLASGKLNLGSVPPTLTDWEGFCASTVYAMSWTPAFLAEGWDFECARQGVPTWPALVQTLGSESLMSFPVDSTSHVCRNWLDDSPSPLGEDSWFPPAFLMAGVFLCMVRHH